ncbi:growth hormone receptor a isoform X1 [Electrophorus electricus]|uniref:Fibronectin type-III domain-containing protein n=2 Tax=Electrophorus electricus TaxID=8005 RepID=A0A4W4H0A6_ELEEL|nr:growth hormone receptor a isoform X1 [Electrophorus electricus]XP_035392298.1 growth hormone receptor a isoform X1 [Electrophorus electricus]XP_035392299.1 growth hormone receptor a isoform X1 [Electrophorus electricus]
MATCLTLLLLGALGLLTATGHRTGPASELLTPDPPTQPHFTGCRSREQETFRCWWSVGSFTNLSEPGALAVFFQMTNTLYAGWRECPEYTASVQNECYFNKTYTHIWTSYRVQLRDTAYNITYDERCFTVENIVHPDPPVALNWTLLNVSRSGLNFDILVRWAPPPSADVQMGWMSLKYEVQYRPRNGTRWEKMDLESGTQLSIYGLNTDKEYEVRVRCTMSAFENFGEFSDSVFVQVAQIPSKESMFPVMLLLVFGGVGLLLLLLLIILSQQERLLVILLPPVPAPKIKGIDPELLKKGKMEQLDSLLRSQNVCKPHSAPKDPWVEFIQLDMEDVVEKSETSDTQHLLGLTHLGSSHALSLKGDDDSGRASCYDPDMGAEPESIPPVREVHSPVVARSSFSTHIHSTTTTPEAAGMHIPVQMQPSSQSWINMDFYAQVSDVTPGGGVLLSPGQQSSTPSKNTDMKKKKEDREEDVAEEEEEEGKLQLLVVDSDGGYSSETVARQQAADAASSRVAEQAYHTLSEPPQPHPQAWQGGYLAPDRQPHMPYFSPEAPLASVLPPVSDYTVVQEVGGSHHLLLHSAAPQASVCPPHPLKLPPGEPALPLGYLTPEFLENLSP